MEMKDTTLFNDIWRTMNDHGLFWEQIWTKFMLKSFLSGVAKYLAKTKDPKMEQPTCVVLKDTKGKVIFGAICEKQENADADGYTLNFFFGDKVPDGSKVVTTDDPTVSGVIKIEALERFHMYFRAIEGTDYLNKLMRIIINAIVEFFKVNLPVNAETEISEKGFFTITGVLVDGKVELTFVPEETLKQIIKDDSSISVVNGTEVNPENPYKLNNAA